MSNQANETSPEAQKPNWKEDLRRQNQQLLLFASIALVFLFFFGVVVGWKTYVYYNVESGMDVIHGLAQPVSGANVEVVPLKPLGGRPSSRAEFDRLPVSALPPASVRDVLERLSKAKNIFVGGHNHPQTLSEGMLVVELKDGRLYFMTFTIEREDGKSKFVIIHSGPEGSLGDSYFKDYESEDQNLIVTLEKAMLGAKQRSSAK
ncbi:hypothetical protein GC197_12460 [bacterium]|nr:hypothetical protein [bacterium]